MAQKNFFDQIYVTEEENGLRADIFLNGRLRDRSRNYLQNLIAMGGVLVNGKVVKAGKKVKTGDVIKVQTSDPVDLKLEPVNLPLNILFENKDLMIIDKPAGLVVHPGRGDAHIKDSLVNALLFHAKDRLSSINGVIRPGIVHRLDKDTSGLLIVAKSDYSHNYLADLFKNGEIEKEYYALLVGKIPNKTGLIEAPIGRDSRNRMKMAVVSRNGKMAKTRFTLMEYCGDFSLVRIRLLTGRTHQIRVHFAEIGYPLAGDRLYGREQVNGNLEERYGLKRQFLHAFRLCFVLPGKKQKTEFISELPEELNTVLEGIRN